MEKGSTMKLKNLLQVIGLGLFALLLTFFISPVKSHAIALFNSSGNDGYFLSLTNDLENVRVVPVSIYDQHSKKQHSKAFLEWKKIKVNYHKFPYNDKDIAMVGSGTDGKEDFKKWAQKKKTTGKMKKHEMLTWTFPGFAGIKAAEDYKASQKDLDRSIWVSDVLVEDFNNAISLVHNSIQEYGNKDLGTMSENQFANLISNVANTARKARNSGKATLKYHGVTFNVTAVKVSKSPKGIPANAYVKFTLKGNDKVNGTFVEYVPKGYRKDSQGRKSFMPLYNQLPKQFKSLVEKKGQKDNLNLNWKLIALQSNSNWAVDGLTFNTIGNITKANKLEQSLADMGSNFLANIRQMLGLYSSNDLIMNNGVRGGDNYYNGIMPKTWMGSADVLHWISYALAWMLIIGAVVKILVERNVAAINPSARVDMINGIKNLMIVGFALSIYDLVFTALAKTNFLIVDVLGASGVGVQSFGTAPVSAGLIASTVVGIVFFCLDVYFNFFYISRGLMVAILYAVGPLYVASIAFGEKYKQIFGNFTKELIGNIFVQSFQAILLVFFVGISTYGNLRTVEVMVLLFCFIPMTKFFKESVGASGSTTDALSNSALGAGAGLAAGLVGSAFSRGGKGDKGGKGNSAGGKEGGMDIATRSGASFGGAKPKSNIKSMAGIGAKAVTKGALASGQAVVGAGLVAGGAATGMRGASQVGGFMVGNSAGKMNDARKEAGLSKDGWAGQAVKKGAKNSIDTLSKGTHAGQHLTEAAKQAKFYGGKGAEVVSKAAKKIENTKTGSLVNAAGKGIKNASSKAFTPQQHAMNAHGIDPGATGAGSPMPKEVVEMDDGSSVQVFDRHNFQEQTGIKSMRDLGPNSSEMEVSTSYVDGQGFRNGSHAGTSNTAYEQNIGKVVKAFKSGDQSEISRYQQMGVNSLKIDPDSNEVSMKVDKGRVGIGDVQYTPQEMIIQKNVSSGSRSKKAQGVASPLGMFSKKLD